MEPSWMTQTMYMPGEVWTNQVDPKLPESTNVRGEVSSIDGSLAVDENHNTFWNVNPAGWFR